MDGKRLTQKRQEQGLAVEVLAKRLGVTKSTLYRYENGFIQKMSADRLMELAALLKTSPEYLLGWTDDDSPQKTELSACFPVRRSPSPAEYRRIQRYIDELLG